MVGTSKLGGLSGGLDDNSNQSGFTNTIVGHKQTDTLLRQSGIEVLRGSFNTVDLQQ